MVFAAAGCTEGAASDSYTGGDFEGDPIIRPETALDREGILDWVNAKGFVTGRDAKVNTVPYGIYGTDLGIPFYSPSQERMYFCFGDTYAATGFRGRGIPMRCPIPTISILRAASIGTARFRGFPRSGNYGRANLQITPDVLLESNYPDIVTKAYHPGTEMNRDEGAGGRYQHMHTHGRDRTRREHVRVLYGGYRMELRPDGAVVHSFQPSDEIDGRR